MKKDKVDLILLMGYLGAGKTTLIQSILKGGEKVAVVQN